MFFHACFSMLVVQCAHSHSPDRDSCMVMSDTMPVIVVRCLLQVRLQCPVRLHS